MVRRIDPRFQADPRNPLHRAALEAVSFGLSFGGPIGTGNIPALGFGPGTPLYAGRNFADEFFGPLRKVGGLGPVAPLYGYYGSEVARALARSGGPARGGLMALFAGTGGGGFDFGGGALGGLIGGVAQGVTDIFTLKQQTKLLKQLNRLRAGGITPTGFAGGGIVPSGGLGVPAAVGGLSALALGLPSVGGILDALPGGLEESGTGLFGPDLFSPTAASARQNMLDAPHPRTGERVYWRPVGRPILFSGDAAVMRRAKKVCSRFMTRAGFGGVARGRRRFRRR